MITRSIGRYTIVETLGRGGMGEVYKARDEALDRWVAIKSVHRGSSLSRERREQLHLEARAAAGLSHPHIAQVHDLIEERGQSYLVMEYVEGERLADRLAGGAIPLVEAVRLGLDVARGLEAAHGGGLVHRDLKPENVMVSASGRAKILDFGLATPPDGHAASDHGAPPEGMAGTLSAMAPEQVERRPVDHRCDLFALGVLLYRMIAFRHPFKCGSPVETLQRIACHHPPAVHDLEPAVPRRLSDLVGRLLSKNPEDRPQDAAEVAEALEDVLSVLAAADRAPARGRRWPAVAVAVAGVAAATGLWLALRPAPLPALYVAVPEPIVEGTSSQELHIVAAGVRVTAVNALSTLDGVFALSSREVDAVSGTPSEIAAAVAADEVLALSVEGGDATCVVRSIRVSGGDGHTLWADQFRVPTDDLQLLQDTLSAHLSRGYGDRRPRRGAFVVRAEPEDFRTYLGLRAEVLEPAPDVSWPSLLDRLARLREQAPLLLNTYLMEVSVARYLYQATNLESHRERAEGVLRELQRIAPDDYRTLLSEAELALACNDLQRADRVVARLDRIAPAHPATLVHRATLAERRGDVDEALRLLAVSVSLRPSWQHLVTLADMELLHGRVAAASEHLARALERAPANTLALARLADLELVHGSPERADELYLQVVAQAPEPHYLTNLGTAQLLEGRFEEAATHFQRAVDAGSLDPVLLSNLGDAFTFLGEPRRAREAYVHTLDILAARPEALQPERLAVKAHCLAQLGRLDEAIPLVRTATELLPHSRDSAFRAAIVFATAGDAPSAALFAGRAMELGYGPSWLGLPWFDPVRGSAEFRDLE